MIRTILLIAAISMVAPSASVAEETWLAGTAQSKITPKTKFWMGGFAARTKPAEGTLHELWVRALALEAPDGPTGVFVSLDLVGVPKWLYDDLCDRIREDHGISREWIRFSASHTHSGPVLKSALTDIYPLDNRQRELIDEYSQWIEEEILKTVDSALASRTPASLSSGIGSAPFGVNRRTNVESEAVEKLANAIEPIGPHDHDVPVLAVRTPNGELRAVVFGYAAHTSALTSNYRWSGDYSGVAQNLLEANHPGTVALFFQGCGSDQSALPRGTVERCEQLGAEMAEAVDNVLGKDMREIKPRFEAAIDLVELPFGDQPDEAYLRQVAEQSDYRARWAKRLLAETQAGKKFATGYAEYPVQVWNLGGDVLWISLGGEVCVDYSLRFKREFGPDTWVAGYTNDVMAYIPSRRLWEEGGYQAGAFEVYGLPAVRWSSDIEDRIASAVHRLTKEVNP